MDAARKSWSILEVQLHSRGEIAAGRLEQRSGLQMLESGVDASSSVRCPVGSTRCGTVAVRFTAFASSCLCFASSEATVESVASSVRTEGGVASASDGSADARFPLSTYVAR